MHQPQLLLVLSTLMLVACSDQPPAASSDPAPAALTKPSVSQAVTVRLDIEVGLQGEVLTARLARGQADTLFAKAALMRVKQQRFPLRTEQQQAVSYWLLDHPVTAGAAQTLVTGSN